MKVQLIPGQMGPKYSGILAAEMQKIIDEYGLTLPGNERPILKISTHMKTLAGEFNYFYKYNPREITKVTVKISYRLFVEFGIERVIKTLRHEMAHWLDNIINDKIGQKTRNDAHDENFLKICVALGGSIPPQYAKGNFAGLAEKEYIRTTYNFEYVCTCGSSVKTKMRFRRFDGRSCRRCGEPLQNWEVKKLG